MGTILAANYRAAGGADSKTVGPWTRYQGPDDPNQIGWGRIFRSLYQVDRVGESQSTLYQATDIFTEAQSVSLAAYSDAPEPVTCSVTRVSVPQRTILALTSQTLRPGGLGPIKIGMSGEEVEAYGLADRVAGSWVTNNHAAALGVALGFNRDKLSRIDVNPELGIAVQGFGTRVTAGSLSSRSEAVQLRRHAYELTTADASQWVLFSPGGALTLWLRPDLTIRRATATSGTSLTNYQTP